MRTPLLIVLSLLSACGARPIAAPIGRTEAPTGRGPAEPAPESQMRVVLGYSGACIVRGDGQLFCWGSNRFGQFGRTTILTTVVLDGIRCAI